MSMPSLAGGGTARPSAQQLIDYCQPILSSSSLPVLFLDHSFLPISFFCLLRCPEHSSPSQRRFHRAVASRPNMSVTTDPRSERTSPLPSSHVFSGPSFPTIYRREKDNPAIGVQRSEYDDGTVSFMNASTTEPLPSGRREKIDRLAPMPENRRLGYMSVAALIINKMIGTCLMRTCDACWLIA